MNIHSGPTHFYPAKAFSPGCLPAAIQSHCGIDPGRNPDGMTHHAIESTA
ncbi:hypothetical protein SynPROSU1_01364 [Synechococcus sp. PROS-U-1]|nr:hypothetical protein SynPROSU1_01364 [Synechococcus sp. PROS-U-1]